jgi:low affinity Fe/Cu permease
MKGREKFERAAGWVTKWAGSVWASAFAFASVAAWFVLGFAYFGFGDSYQMIINTGTTILTFLMVFLIQNTQNRESRALHLKVDELVLKLERADNRFVGIESLTEEELADLSARCHKAAQVVGTRASKMSSK